MHQGRKLGHKDGRLCQGVEDCTEQCVLVPPLFGRRFIH